MNTPLCISSWNMRLTANTMYSLQFHSEAPGNGSKYESPRVEQLLLETHAQTNEAKRKEMYCEIQPLISDEAVCTVAYHRNCVDAVAKNLKGMPEVPLAAFGGAEFVWLS